MASDLLGTLFKAMSGLQGFTQGLDNLSNNVANLNTTGYKANDVFYRELDGNQQFGSTGDDGSFTANGQGVAVGGTKIRFVDGELAETGNDTDIAIEGNGYFIVRDDKEEFYTRSGEFVTDDEGFLVDPGTNFRVAKVNESGKLEDINLREQLVSEAEASDKVRLRGVLNRSATEGEQYPPSDATDAELIEITVYDDQGQNYTVFAQFTKAQGAMWRVDFLDDNGAEVAKSETIDFGANGAPTTDSLSKTIDFNLFDFVATDNVSERFDGVELISISDTPGELDKLGEFEMTLSEGEFITQKASGEGGLSFITTGSFKVNDEGKLVDAATNRVLSARDPSNTGQLVDAQLELEHQQLATRAIELSGVLDALAPVGVVYPALVDTDGGIQVQPDPIRMTVFDEDGVEYGLTVSFTRIVSGANTAEYEVTFNYGQDSAFNASSRLSYTRENSSSSWTLQTENFSAVYNTLNPQGDSVSIAFDIVVDDAFSPLTVASGVASDVAADVLSGGAVGLITGLEIQSDGQVRVSYSNGAVENGPILAVVDSRGGGIQGLEIDFSAVNTAEFTTSGVEVEDVNGRATGQLTSFSVQEDGTIMLEYSNEDEVDSGRIALALFSNESSLVRKGDSLFVVDDLAQRVIGSGEDGAFGSLVHKSIERSNVELSREFAEIIIVQRGFQAASQVLNATNELIEELYNSTRGGR
jgi:flagellar hook protein FlgE